MRLRKKNGIAMTVACAIGTTMLVVCGSIMHATHASSDAMSGGLPQPIGPSRVRTSDRRRESTAAWGEFREPHDVVTAVVCLNPVVLIGESTTQL